MFSHYIVNDIFTLFHSERRISRGRRVNFAQSVFHSDRAPRVSYASLCHTEDGKAEAYNNDDISAE
jgi:hypothetical protein